MKTCELTEQLNARTGGRFSFLKLSFGEADLKKKCITLAFLYPEDKEAEVYRSEAEITECVRAVAAVPCTLNVKFVKSHFDANDFRRRLFRFLFAYPVLSSGLTDRDVTVGRDENGIVITLHIEESLVDYCEDKQVIRAIEDFIELSYCQPIRVRVEPKKETRALDSIDEYARRLEYEASGVALENADERRLIRPQMVEEFIGDIIYDMARYICDCTRPEQRLVVCGAVENFQQLERKNAPEGKPKHYYKFTLKDPTGEMNCIYFPNRKTDDKMTLIKNGREMVCCGDLDIDKFRPGQMTYSVRRISLCVFPKDFTINRLVRKVDEVYHCVFPQPYVVAEQGSLFQTEEKIPAYAADKTFCVFDIETTGLNTATDKIIEIGAVRIENGRITETFSTFIDPGVPIPERITQLTTITDDDVKGAPSVEDVLPDFYKFSYNTIMVGQNVQFDYGFVSAAGQAMNIYFDNERVDTLALGRKYLTGLTKFKLGNLTEYFGIRNKGAHRAIYDAIATAEVFLKLAEFIT